MRHKHKRPPGEMEKVPTISKPHATERHVVARGRWKEREYYLHATKGYRSKVDNAQ